MLCFAIRYEGCGHSFWLTEALAYALLHVLSDKVVDTKLSKSVLVLHR